MHTWRCGSKKTRKYLKLPWKSTHDVSETSQWPAIFKSSLYLCLLNAFLKVYQSSVFFSVRSLYIAYILHSQQLRRYTAQHINPVVYNTNQQQRYWRNFRHTLRHFPMHSLSIQTLKMFVMKAADLIEVYTHSVRLRLHWSQNRHNTANQYLSGHTLPDTCGDI